MKKHLALLLALLLLAMCPALALAEETAGAAEVQAKREARVKLGCPYPEGVNVKLNDAYLLFPKGKPYLEDGNLYLPLRDFLAAAGVKARIDFDAATGQAQVSLPEGEPWSVSLAEGALLQNGVLYVDDYYLCDFLGWDRSWDYYNEILYLVESEALIAKLDASFGIYNLTLKRLTPISEGAQKFSGSLRLSGQLYKESGSDIAYADLSYDGLADGADLDISLALDLDIDKFKNTLLSGLTAEDWRLLKAIGASRARLLINSETDGVYLQSTLLALLDQRLGSHDWLQMAERPQWGTLNGYTVGRMIYENALSNRYYYGDSDIYAAAVAKAALWQSLLGDGQFKREQSGGYNTYTLKADEKQLGKLLREQGFDLPMAQLFGYGGYNDGQLAGLSYQLSFGEKDGRILELQTSATATGGALPVKYALQFSYDAKGIQGSLEIDGQYIGKFGMEWQHNYTPTKEKPASAPPAGSRIVPEREFSSYIPFF